MFAIGERKKGGKGVQRKGTEPNNASGEKEKNDERGTRSVITEKYVSTKRNNKGDRPGLPARKRKGKEPI